MPLVSRLITGRIPPSPRRNSADSTAGCHASTLVCQTCGWDPRSGIYRAATGPPTTFLHTRIFVEVFGRKYNRARCSSIVPSRLPVPLGVWGYVMRDLKAPVGPVPGWFLAFSPYLGREGTKKFELLKCDELPIQNVPIRQPGPWRAWRYATLDPGTPGRARAGPVLVSRSPRYL